MASAIIVAAGNGSRANLGKNKILAEMNGKTVLENTLSPFIESNQINEIVVATSEADYFEVETICSKQAKAITVCRGGATRYDSVKNALEHVYGDIVLIHDGARPYLDKALIERCIDGVIKNGSAISAIPSSDTIATVEDGKIISTARTNQYLIQTPQAFFTRDIKKAYALTSSEMGFTDDSSVYNAIIGKSFIVEGSRENLKLTYAEDFLEKYKTGVGFDLHQLTPGRKLILGGIEIPHTKGLLGHSDADVLTHAIMDALLSALALRDIGYHFPDTDPQYKDISSIILLKHVLQLIDEKGYRVSNISAVIMAEKPKLSTFIPEISTNLAKVINISTSSLGITCTTLEKVGTVGREEAIAVEAYVMLKRK